jgi:hypothetical protein
LPAVAQSRSNNPRQPLEAMAEEFLYHLYRGSELLADGRYDGAREELDRALRAQPRDAAAQDLLAKVYFKLGLYPRAIELYQEIVRQFPDRIPPRINLALAFLKTGQMRDVVSQLLPVIEREPEHGRAWGYLGLAWSRLGEYAKAKEAFVRAGHDAMARRMEEALDSQYAPAPRNDTGDLVRPSMLPAADLEPTGAVSIPPPSKPPRDESETPSIPRDASRGDEPETFTALAEALSIAPRGDVLEIDDGGVVVVGGCAARLGPTSIEAGLERGDEVERHGREGTFAGGPGLVWLRSGWAAIPHRAGRTRTLLFLRDESVVAREERVLAFEGTLLFENESFASHETIDTVRFRGRGRVVLETAASIRSVPVRANQPCVVPLALVVGWSAGITIAPAAWGDRIAAHGEGHVLVAIEGPGALGEAT